MVGKPGDRKWETGSKTLLISILQRKQEAGFLRNEAGGNVDRALFPKKLS
jgi:hypothetical protein